ncbi:ABC transporter ATP-binding protein [Mycobacteroides immunogenum]|uniref:ABC transporter ATP-binding protein n=1 Tax=Mycobacteroides immunogenum TaxID=83262 RepID=UPI000695F814|nr:ABC transporter ATP-binding protein [Mycobacteroides immunogenum]ANO05586.1 peptide ABC transporter ATP-binding protein [Mycobacteroides immunogenum]MCV7305951.1 ABC transporter ATP-binding protein [Mycobacteroides immunogenum]ORV78042.1 peptide ABC transporter ATP-binding protein [Mycobacteroides immunogenum]WJR32826.1 ABC transporter ATP-binding protein [Mycobacteroides immunogenum]
MTRNVLSAKDLRVTFSSLNARGEVHAVDGVTLDLHEGEILALVGASGSGKTTLSRTLLGLEQPTSGEVTALGEPLPTRGKALRAYRRHTQLVMQDPSGALNPKHSVYESVAEGIRLHRIVKKASERGEDVTETELVSQALLRAGMRRPEQYFLSYPHELSGGQRQRVLIAGALAVEPKVLIADEPVSSLDASIRGEILALFLSLRNELGLSLLVVTHDLGLAWNIADRVAVMSKGQIVECGTTEDVLLRPTHEYTRGLLAALPGEQRPDTASVTATVR